MISTLQPYTPTSVTRDLVTETSIRDPMIRRRVEIHRLQQREFRKKDNGSHPREPDFEDGLGDVDILFGVAKVAKYAIKAYRWLSNYRQKQRQRQEREYQTLVRQLQSTKSPVRQQQLREKIMDRHVDRVIRDAVRDIGRQIERQSREPIRVERHERTMMA